MKKFLLAIIAIALVVVSSLTLFACSNGGEGETPKNSGLVLTKYNGENFYTVTGYNTEDTAKTLNIPAKAEDGIAIKKIAEGALDGCSYEEIIVPTSVEEIGAGAFKNATKLKKITLPFAGKYFNSDAYLNQTPEGDAQPTDGDYSTVKAVDTERSFGYIFSSEAYDGGVITSSSLASYYLPATLRTVVINPKADYEIPMGAFDSLIIVNEIQLSDKVVGIGEGAFKNVKLSRMEIPARVANIYDSAFEGATVTQFTFNEGSQLKALNDKVFYNAKIRMIEIPNGVESIGEECFSATVTNDVSTSILEKVTLPQSLKSIKRGAFYNCYELKNLDYSKVTAGAVELEDYAFLDCKNLTVDANLKAICKTPIKDNAFLGTK